MDDNRASKLYEAADKASDREEFAYALELSRELLSEYPETPLYWAEHGRILRALGRYAEAEKAFRFAIRRTDSDFVLWLCYWQLGELLSARGDFDGANANYERVIEIRPDDASGYIWLAVSHWHRGDCERVIALMKRAVQCRTGCIDEAYLNLAIALRSQERYPEALEAVEAALKICPDFGKAVVVRNDLLRAAKFALEDVRN